MESVDSRLRLLLVGPYPPPYGGIAMTMMDLRRYLEGRQVGDVMVLNIGQGRAVPSDEYLSVLGQWDFVQTIVKFAVRGYTIHLETNGHNFKSWLSALVCAAAGFLNQRKTVIAFGSGNLPVYLRGVSWVGRFVAWIVMRWAGIVICRNESMVEAVRSLGSNQVRIEVVPGFMGISGRSLGTIPEMVETFCAAHTPLLGATVTLAPEYGVPLIVEAVERLRDQYPRVGLVLIGIGPEVEGAMSSISGVKDHILLAGALPPDVTLAVMARLSVFVRPTYFEGDSVSIREALALKIPVVASDTGLRPGGVRKFKIGDCSDLCRHLVEVVSIDHTREGGRQGNGQMDGSAPIMLELYRCLR